MSEDLRVPETTAESLEHFALHRAVAPADWERASKYLNRIRTSSIRADDLPSLSVLVALQVSFLADSFCPNFRDLRWLQPSSTQYIRSFFRPRITRIWISPKSLDHHSLDFYFMRSDPELVKFVSALVRRLHHLQSLTATNLDTAAFEHIAHLGTLKCLSLGDLGGFAAVIETGDAAYASRFPVLEDLDVETITPDFLLGLLESGPNRALHTLHVSFVRYPTLAETAQLIPSTSKTGSRPTYTGTVRMARAWPNIEKLNLLPKFDHHDFVNVTLDGLQAFAQYCPQLKTLGIYRSLTQLDVGCSAIWRAKPVAAFIAAHFSEVHHVSASGREYDPDDDGRKELWKAVDRKLDKMRTTTT
ncbi:hypothetical protein C8J57DRAFT_1521549 [Mycena rebaudengoi]|nr:hypothetical protein C8J57DRAFT_1521549 [Mycena rebaudengoi]